MITLFLDDERLDSFVKTADLAFLPLTPTGWDTHWHTATRQLIDAVVDHGRVLTAPGLPHDTPVTLRYDLLAEPPGLQLSVQTGADDDLLGVRLATTDYTPGAQPTCTAPNPAIAAATILDRIVADLDFHLRALQIVVGLPVDPPKEIPVPTHIHTPASAVNDAIAAFNDAADGPSGDDEHEAAVDLADAAARLVATTPVRIADCATRILRHGLATTTSSWAAATAVLDRARHAAATFIAPSRND